MCVGGGCDLDLHQVAEALTPGTDSNFVNHS